MAGEGRCLAWGSSAACCLRSLGSGLRPCVRLLPRVPDPTPEAAAELTLPCTARGPSLWQSGRYSRSFHRLFCFLPGFATGPKRQGEKSTQNSCQHP